MQQEEKLIKNAGIIIRNHRKLKGHTIEELANLADVHHTHLSKIERGKAAMSLPVLFKIAGGLNLKPSFLTEEFEEDTFHLFEEDVKLRTK
jgi:transcriptional regulator with XRE-family HTH domain